MHSLQFCADISKKSKPIKAICIYTSKMSPYALSENSTVYYSMTYVLLNLEILWFENEFLNFCWVSIFCDILITDISWTLVQTPINQLFWKGVMRTFRYIYLNCFNKLMFLAEVSTKLQKMHFFGNLRTITQKGNIETWQMKPFFLSTFSGLFIFEFENSQNSFLCGPSFGPFWSVEYINFGQKLPIWIATAHHTFLESINSEVPKNPYHVLYPPGEPKKVSAHGLF